MKQSFVSKMSTSVNSLEEEEVRSESSEITPTALLVIAME